MLSPKKQSAQDRTFQDGALTAELKTAQQLSASTSNNSATAVKIATERRPEKERRIVASVLIPQPIDLVWKVITDYEHLADFVPNLTSSKLIPNSEGRIRLEQMGTQCFLKFKFCARVVLDMTEQFPHEVGFDMKEGDFKMFKGAWKLRPDEDQRGTELSYDLLVKPPRAMPAALIEHHICHNLTTNLLAIRQRTMDLAI
ncbi:MAG: cyclase [Phormidesmis priestleyi]|uniref:Cyclase n=1 Tax=Phormidesmis priestleyi TaxID=268141 RepID=A0A2W4XKS7_9CYAN|nr:MAG: cyclase [Phormidesmis priestleyi]